MFASSGCKSEPTHIAPPPTTGAEVRASESSASQRASLNSLLESMPATDAPSHFARGVELMSAAEDRGFGAHAYELAVIDFGVTIALDASSVDAYANRAMAQVRLGKPADAIADLTVAIGLSPKDPQLLFMRGSAYSRSTQDRKAIDDYTAALALEPNPKVRFNRGNAYTRIGDKINAVADFRALASSPTTNARMKQEALGNIEALAKN